VSRRLLGPILGAFVLLLPTLVGRSDALPERQPRPQVLSGPVIATALTAPPGDVEIGLDPVGPASVWSPGHGPHTGFHPATNPRELLLSFDDGPDLDGTPLILDELDRHGLKAIFFVTGWRFVGDRPEDQARRDLLRKIAAHGHLVANHTFTHHNVCQKPAETAAQIDDNSALIEKTTGLRPLLFRAPYGGFCHGLEAALAARELPDIGWNLDPQDWKNRREEDVFNYLVKKLSKLRGRGILLMHDTHSASVRALPRVLEWLAQQNARDVAAGRPPVKIIDYDVLVPKRPQATTGLERVVTDVVADAGGSLARLWP
jgi:peptidoglycan/xylan/chitin deacetylase (PgdA/CDA1 family)